MRALTVRQPWAYAIFHLGQDVENRTWQTHYRGRLSIHVAKRVDLADCRTLELGLILKPFRPDVYLGPLTLWIAFVDTAPNGPAEAPGTEFSETPCCSRRR